MVGRAGRSIIVPEVRVYEASRGEYIVLKNVGVDTHHACDSQGRVIYFTLEESGAHLKKQGKSLPSLPLLVNLYIALDELAVGDEAAAEVLHQLNTSWDRTGTSISPAGIIVHRDSILGEITCDGLKVPQEGGGLVRLFEKNERFFKALLGVKDIDRLVGVADRHSLSPFYWYPEESAW